MVSFFVFTFSPLPSSSWCVGPLHLYTLSLSGQVFSFPFIARASGWSSRLRMWTTTLVCSNWTSNVNSRFLNRENLQGNYWQIWTYSFYTRIVYTINQWIVCKVFSQNSGFWWTFFTILRVCPGVLDAIWDTLILSAEVYPSLNVWLRSFSTQICWISAFLSYSWTTASSLLRVFLYFQPVLDDSVSLRSFYLS